MEALVVSTYMLMRTNPFWCLTVAGMMMFTPLAPGAAGTAAMATSADARKP